ncbi:ABC transporter permease, partial [Mesorhizobium sp. M00.F.Ca.ET.186.01.1.1]
MFVYIVRRLLQMIPVLLGVILVVFLIMQMVPGDPAVLLAGEGASAETIAKIRAQLGLDQPVMVQYFHYVTDVMTGDLGTSLRSNLPVFDEIAARLPATIELAIA